MGNKIKIVFFGYDYLGGQFLQVLLNEYADKIEVAAVSTNIQQKAETISKKIKRAKKLWKKKLFFKEMKEKIFYGSIINGRLLKNPAPSSNDITVKQLAEKNSIPIISSLEVLAGNAAIVDTYQPDYIIVASFGKIPEAVYAARPDRVINFHPSLLPQLRGGSPVYSAIMRGMAQSGFSFHQLSQVFDAGPLLYQEVFHLNENDNCRQTETNIAIAGAHKLYHLLNGIQNQTINTIDISGRQITHCIRNYEISLLLEPHKSTTTQALQKIRACASWPLGAAYIRKGLRHFYIEEAQAAQWPHDVANENIVYLNTKGLLVKTNDGAILVTKLCYQQKHYTGRELAQFKRQLFEVYQNE